MNFDLVSGPPDTKRLIIALLSNEYSLTAKQIYYFLKRSQKLSSTYQSVHKTLGAMVSKGVLEKDNNNYKIDKRWVESLALLSSEIMKKVDRKEKELLKEFPRFNTRVGSSIKVISFDLDGCLSREAFDEELWRTTLPKVYAEEKGISFETAYEEISAEKRRLWGVVHWWKDPSAWLSHFKLKATFEDLIRRSPLQILHYPDARPVLQELSKSYKIVVISGATRTLLNMKLGVEGLHSFVSRSFSTSSDFNIMRREFELYKLVCEALNISPSEMIHIGDHYEFDYQVPSSLGIRSFLLDRKGMKNDPYVVRDLYEFKDKIKCF